MWKTGVLSASLLAYGIFPSFDEFSISGVGAAKCSELRAYGSHSEQQEQVDLFFLTWAQGFLSGINFGNNDSTGKTKNLMAFQIEEQIKRIQAFCKEHPEARIYEAALRLYEDLPNSAPRR